MNESRDSESTWILWVVVILLGMYADSLEERIKKLEPPAPPAAVAKQKN